MKQSGGRPPFSSATARELRATVEGMPPTHPPALQVFDPVALEALGLAQAFTETASRAHEFAQAVLEPIIAEHRKRESDAHSQRASADTLRNRAARLPEGEHRAELLGRADRFEKRSAVILAGELMPRELRYPLDSLRLVAKARDALIAAADAIDGIDADEVHAFLQSLRMPTEQDRVVGEGPIASDAPAMLVRNEIGRHLEMLGVYLDAQGQKRLRPFGLAIAMPQASPAATQAPPPATGERKIEPSSSPANDAPPEDENEAEAPAPAAS